MRFTRLLALSLLVIGVLSKGLAGAYERIYYYLIYELEADLWKNGQYWGWAHTCLGSGKDNRCNFNEFIYFIETGRTDVSNAKEYIPRGTALGRDDNSLRQAANSLLQKGATGELQHTNLILRSKNNVGFIGLIRGSANTMKRLKKTANKRKVIITKEENDIRKVASTVVHLRSKDHDGILLRHLKTAFPKANFRTIPKSDPIAGQTYRGLDLQATILANQNLGLTYKTLSDEITKFNEDKTKPVDPNFPNANSGHLKVIQQFQSCL
ncbi:MAG: hypothetical protein HETSPECPRED_000530 [Heterodermia speciosa]|uniref:Effector protein n=1 Tax=Heterodermia speciosa TaxID=116794 RepID=A0A8H3GA56_9LECA|nr:MAG: hypothetical protein HETSPECPRED_000530 [Heterodermia speciosa]